MNLSKKDYAPIKLLIATALLAVSLAGCGSGDCQAKAAAQPTVAPGPPSAPPPTTR
jgi:hypothetical protein